tara:strand:- start:1774 stop:2052 length:279 start_codon:yes stop_codon:yes gene_type:complete
MLGWVAACTLRRFHLFTNGSSASRKALMFLQTRKKHSIGLVAGTGPSVGLLTGSQSRLLQTSMDIWGMNQFFLHKTLGASVSNLSAGSTAWR